MKRNTKPAVSAVAIAYVRVSTEEQASEGVSLDAQEARIRAYCAMRGLELAEVVVDAGVSAGKPLASRDGGLRVLDAVRSRKVGAVVALKLDRLFRNCADCLDVTAGWDKLGVALHLVDLGGQAVDTSSAMGRFFLTVMAGAAELERNQIRERTAMAMQHLAARGMYTGGEARFGCARGADGALVEVQAEQEVIACVHTARAQGLSLRAVVAELERAGIVGRTGRPLALAQVANIVRAAA
jgi:site-specific DNA recombinase